MKNLKLFVIGLVLAGWMSLLLHSHPSHPRDLHPGHSDCPICSVSNRISSQILPVDHTTLVLPAGLGLAIFPKAEDHVLHQARYSNPSRAPPIA